MCNMVCYIILSHFSPNLRSSCQKKRLTLLIVEKEKNRVLKDTSNTLENGIAKVDQSTCLVNCAMATNAFCGK